MLNNSGQFYCYEPFCLVVAIATKGIIGTHWHIPVIFVTESCGSDVVRAVFGIPESLFAEFSGLVGFFRR